METGVVLPALAPSAPYSTSLDCQRRTSQCFNNLFAYIDHRQKDGDSDEHFCQLSIRFWVVFSIFLENCTPALQNPHLSLRRNKRSVTKILLRAYSRAIAIDGWFHEPE